MAKDAGKRRSAGRSAGRRGGCIKELGQRRRPRFGGQIGNVGATTRSGAREQTRRNHGRRAEGAHKSLVGLTAKGGPAGRQADGGGGRR